MLTEKLNLTVIGYIVCTELFFLSCLVFVFINNYYYMYSLFNWQCLPVIIVVYPFIRIFYVALVCLFLMGNFARLLQHTETGGRFKRKSGQYLVDL